MQKDVGMAVPKPQKLGVRMALCRQFHTQSHPYTIFAQHSSIGCVSDFLTRLACTLPSLHPQYISGFWHCHPYIPLISTAIPTFPYTILLCDHFMVH